jgi:hypothetical protein
MNMDVLNPMTTTKAKIRKRMKGACGNDAAIMAAASGPPRIAGGLRPEAAPVALKTEAEIRALSAGGEAEYKYPNDEFDAVEDRLASEWNAAVKPAMPWTQARGAVKDAYDRSVQIRRARACPEACDDLQED